MHWTLTVALIGSFLVAVSGQCAHLETKIQQDLALISKLQDQLTDLQWKLAENLFKDDLIASLNSKIENLSQGNPSCACVDSASVVEIVQDENSCKEASKPFENKIKECEAKVRKLEEDILKQTTTTKPPKTKKTTINPNLEAESEEDNETDEEENPEEVTDEDYDIPKKTTKPPKKKKPTKKPPRDLSEISETTEEEEDIEEEEEPPKRKSRKNCVSYGFATKIRTIKIPGVKPFAALCDGNAFGPGWTVIQNRFNGNVEFYRGWKEYKRGFGSLKGEFFLGLEHIYRMTNYERYELFIQLDSTKGGFIYARYDDFQIGNEASRYVLRKVGAMTGTAEDRLTIHVGHMFSTYDQGDMMENENVAVKYHSGWWHVKTVLGIR
ncbi:hypothetical protein ACLKA6_017417 [Drosophila palustris]